MLEGAKLTHYGPNSEIFLPFQVFLDRKMLKMASTFINLCLKTDFSQYRFFLHRKRQLHPKI